MLLDRDQEIAQEGIERFPKVVEGRAVRVYGDVLTPETLHQAAQDCARLDLGHLAPAKISVDEWKDREDEGVLYVPKADEILYRPR